MHYLEMTKIRLQKVQGVLIGKFLLVCLSK